MQTYDDANNVYTIELWSGEFGKIRSVTTSQAQASINIAGLPSGWYQLLLVHEGEILETGKVFISL